MMLEQQIFDVARWLLLAVVLWWITGAILWFGALRGDQVWLRRLAATVALPGGRRLASSLLAFGLATLPACSPERSQPTLVYLGEAASSSTVPSTTIPPTTRPSTTKPADVPTDATAPPPTRSSSDPPSIGEESPDTSAFERAADAQMVTGSHTVEVGDHLWSIAAQHLSSGGAAPDNDAIAGYWRQVITANAETIRSGDPNLIVPGEIIALPPSS